MLDPISMKNQIFNQIMARLPSGEMFRTSAAHPPEVTAPPAETTNETTFNALVQQLAPALGIALPEMPTEPETITLQIEREIQRAAINHNLDPELIRALIRAESNFRPDAVSSAGAMGLMQLMPRTAASLGVTDPFDIAQNIDGGSRYLRRMLDLFNGDTHLALAAYNAGAGAVRQHGGIPPFRETQAFVPRVHDFWNENIAAAYERVLTLNA